MIYIMILQLSLLSRKVQSARCLLASEQSSIIQRVLHEDYKCFFYQHSVFHVFTRQ